MPLSVKSITPSVMHSVTGTASHMPCGKMNIGIRINAGTRNKQHTQRSPKVLLSGLIIADDGHIHSKEYGRISKHRKSTYSNLIGISACLQEKADKRFGSQGKKHCCQYATDGSGSETNPEGFSHTVAIACTIIETDDKAGLTVPPHC